jgi:hypothetical protein
MTSGDSFTVWCMCLSACMMANGLTLMMVGKILKDMGK